MYRSRDRRLRKKTKKKKKKKICIEFASYTIPVHSIVLIAQRSESKSLDFKAIEIRKCRFFRHKTDRNIARNPQ